VRFFFFHACLAAYLHYVRVFCGFAVLEGCVGALVVPRVYASMSLNTVKMCVQATTCADYSAAASFYSSGVLNNDDDIGFSTAVRKLMKSTPLVTNVSG